MSMASRLFGSSVQTKVLEGIMAPLKCIMVAGLLLVIIVAPVFLGILGIPIDLALLFFTAFIGKDFFGLSGFFKGFGGIFK